MFDTEVDWALNQDIVDNSKRCLQKMYLKLVLFKATENAWSMKFNTLSLVAVIGFYASVLRHKIYVKRYYLNGYFLELVWKLTLSITGSNNIIVM